MLTQGQFGLAIVLKASGQVLPVITQEGRNYVAAPIGQEFNIRVTAPRGRRYEAVLSVDGRNVQTGEKASTSDRGLVFPDGVWETQGWRQSDSKVAQFVFVDPSDSYAALTGDASNVGVIGVALYTERMAAPEFILRSSPQTFGGGVTKGVTRGGHDAGTGYGRQQTEVVGKTDFPRDPVTPVATLVIEYATEASLRARGILKDPPLGAVTPFPADTTPAITGAKPPKGWTADKGTPTTTTGKRTRAAAGGGGGRTTRH